MSGWTRFDRSCKHCVVLHDEMINCFKNCPVPGTWYDRWSLHIKARHPVMADWIWPFPKTMPEDVRARLRQRRIEDLQRKLNL